MMRLKKLSDEPGICEVALEGKIYSEDVPPDSLPNPLASVLGDAWAATPLLLDLPV